MLQRIVLIVMLLSAGSSFAEPRITEAGLRNVSEELVRAMEENDFSVISKYLHPTSRIIIDLDPTPGQGQKEISYDDYMPLAEMGMAMMADAKISNEILSIEIDCERNQGTIEEKTTVTANIMGVHVNEVTITTSVYGVIDGDIKVISAVGDLVFSEMIEQ